MRRPSAHCLADERGQSTIEYVGIVAVVGTVVGLLIAAAPDWGRAIVKAIGSQIDKILGG